MLRPSSQFLLFTLLCQYCLAAAPDSKSSSSSWSANEYELHRRLDDRADDPSERDAYELVAFLLWYIFLVLCCVVPTCCAYRRRRLVEQRMAQQQESFARMQESNFFFLSTLTSRRDGEVVQAERSRILTDALKDTTMTVKEADLETLPPSEARARPSWTHGEIVAMHGGPDEETQNSEYDIEETDHLRVLQLPPNRTNGDRKVPGVCAICLCAYEAGDVVAWSAEDSCLHAFHNDCLVPWLAKKNEPHCPVCRQSFCKVSYNENETSIYDSPFTFSQSFSQALARARLEASLMSRMESGGLDGDLEIVHVQNGGALRSNWMTATAPTSSSNTFSARAPGASLVEPNPESVRPATTTTTTTTANLAVEDGAAAATTAAAAIDATATEASPATESTLAAADAELPSSAEEAAPSGNTPSAENEENV